MKTIINSIHIIVTVFVFLFYGCTNNSNNKLEEFFSKKFPNFYSGEIIVIPGSGCTGCISDAERSLDSLLKIKNNRILFSQIKSIKILKNRLHNQNINPEDSKIYLDINNQYIEHTEKYSEFWSFPTKMTLNNGRVVKIEIFKI